jgi:peptide/nickel transport system substrate-binding protein/oligopeptide transport system substrate-binding protein
MRMQQGRNRGAIHSSVGRDGSTIGNSEKEYGFLPTRRDFVTGAVTAGVALGAASLLGGCVFPFGAGRRGANGAGEIDGLGRDGEQDPRAGGTLHFASHWPYSFDPFYLQELSGIQIASCLFDPLVRYDYRQQKLVGAAAESWKVAKEGTLFTFKLVRDAHFHNGETVTAKDFKYSWERLFRESPLPSDNLPSSNASYISMIQGAEEMMAGEAKEVSGIRALDRVTLEVELTFPFFEFCQVIAYPAFAPVPSTGEASDFLGFDEMPIGNGVFRMEDAWDWQSDVLRLVRFDDYHGTPALLKAVEFRFFASDQKPGSGSGNAGDLWVVTDRHRRGVRGVGSVGGRLQFAGGRFRTADVQFRTYEEKTYAGLQDGDLDVAQIPLEELDDARARYGEAQDGYTATPDAQVLSGQELCTQYLWVNFNREPFTDAAVRRALSHAINREAICTELYHDTISPATGIVPPGIEGFREKAWPAAVYDVNRAKRILEEAGYPEGKGLGLVTLVASDTEEETRLFEMIKTDLEAAGFTVRLAVVKTANLFWDTLDRSAALALTGWIADFPLMENFLTPLFTSTGSSNEFGYHNEEVDEGIVAARALENDAKRIGAFREVENIISADMPVIPLFYTRHSLVCSDRTNDLFVAPDEIADFSKVWVSS